MLLHHPVQCSSPQEGRLTFYSENNHHKKLVMALGGYFLCENDSIATINVPNVNVINNDSNTVILSPPSLEKEVNHHP